MTNHNIPAGDLLKNSEAFTPTIGILQIRDVYEDKQATEPLRSELRVIIQIVPAKDKDDIDRWRYYCIAEYDQAGESAKVQKSTGVDDATRGTADESEEGRVIHHRVAEDQDLTMILQLLIKSHNKQIVGEWLVGLRDHQETNGINPSEITRLEKAFATIEK